MKRNMRVAYAHYALAALCGVATVMALFLTIEQAVEGGDQPWELFLLLVVLAAPMTYLHYRVARGAIVKSDEAKKVSRIFGVLYLFGFPIGTAIGIFLLANSVPSWEDAEASAPLTSDAR